MSKLKYLMKVFGGIVSLILKSSNSWLKDLSYLEADISFPVNFLQKLNLGTLCVSGMTASDVGVRIGVELCNERGDVEA